MSVRQCFFVLLLLWGVSMVTAGCGDQQAKAAMEKEMVTAPHGYWYGQGPQEGWELNIDAGGQVTLQRGGQQLQGSYTLDSTGTIMKVDLNGQQQDWKFERKQLDILVTFPDQPEPVTFRMQ